MHTRTWMTTLILLLGSAGTASAQLDLSWNNIGPGGRVEMVGGTLTLGGTIGEFDAGSMTGGSLELHGGFWAGIEPGNCAGDVNGDGVTDLTDLALILSDFGCSGGCTADLTGDGNTDLSDLAIVLSDFGCS